MAFSGSPILLGRFTVLSILPAALALIKLLRVSGDCLVPKHSAA